MLGLAIKQRGKSTTDVQTVETLSKRDKELAASVETHEYFGGLLLDAINDARWPMDDKRGDQLEAILNDKGKKREIEDGSVRKASVACHMGSEDYSGRKCVHCSVMHDVERSVR